LIGNHQNLAECKGHALAQLIRRLDGELEPRLLTDVLVDVIASGFTRLQVRPVVGSRRSQLLRKPGVEADGFQVGDPRHAWPQRGLGQEALRVP
jgi:hypothetical protein